LGRGDLAALHLPGLGVQVVEGDLFPVDVEPAYDGHRDLPKLWKGREQAPRAKCLCAVNRDASELRRSRARKAPASAQPGPMHVIYSATGCRQPGEVGGIGPIEPSPARATNAAGSYQVNHILVRRPSRPPVRPALWFSERTRSIRGQLRGEPDRAATGRAKTEPGPLWITRGQPCVNTPCQ
jgi:hypothetical protein